MLEIATTLLDAIIGYTPALLTLALAIGILWLLNRNAMKPHPSGQLQSRFRQQLLTLVIAIGTLVVIIITLPLENETRGQVLTLFGLLLTAIVTLSSPTVAANAMAGFMLRTLNNFSLGDFIQVGDFFGRVTEQNLFHTEIQTEDSDLLTLPNLFLINNPVKVIQASGTIVSAEVSLGYDVHHSIIEPLLLAAAKEAKLEDAFVQILQLGDFSVNYRIAGFLAPAKHLLSARSLLRKQIMDQLHNHTIEIVSPNFMNQRPVTTAVIPQPPAIVPTVTTVTGTTEESNPEELIFDKAEKAQQLRELKESLEELKQSLEQLKADGAGKDDPRYVRQRRRMKGLYQAIKLMEAEGTATP